MRILGIETSCDETAVAIIEISGSLKEPRVKVLSNIVSSQAKLHAKFGGVVPNLAKREHQRNLVPVLFHAFSKAGFKSSKFKVKSAKLQFKIKKLSGILYREPELFARIREYVLPLKPPKIDAIAVTVGPGLAPALWVGVNFARALAYLWEKPIIPVNHLEGHIYTNLLQQFHESTKSKARNLKQIQNSKSQIPNSFEFRISNFEFPAIALLVSGGHTELVLMKDYGKYKIVGETLDDAAGEAFDKVAKMLGLSFPGGPIISRLAERGDAKAFAFPRPMLSTKNFDFSFSGLKTAVLYTIRKIKHLSDRAKRDVAASFEQAVVDVLVSKTLRAAKAFRVKTVMIGGGVAANKELRRRLGETMAKNLLGIPLLLPDPTLTGDNALMIALAGHFRKGKKATWKPLQAKANFRLDEQC